MTADILGHPGLLDQMAKTGCQFYSFRCIFKRLPKNKSQRNAYLLFNLLYRKFGHLTSALACILPMRMIGKLATKISYGENCNR